MAIVYVNDGILYEMLYYIAPELALGAKERGFFEPLKSRKY